MVSSKDVKRRKRREIETMEIIKMDGRNYYTNCLGYLPNAIERAFDAIDAAKNACYELMASIECGQYNINDELFAVLESAEKLADDYESDGLHSLIDDFNGVLFNFDDDEDDRDDFYGIADDIRSELDKLDPYQIF